MNETQCVARGAILLDEKIPGWHEEINWNTLDIWSPKRCLLSQLHNAGFEGILSRLGLGGMLEIRQYGFDAEPGVTTFPALNRAWRAWAEENINQ